MPEYIQSRVAFAAVRPQTGVRPVAAERSRHSAVPFALVLLFILALYSQIGQEIPFLTNQGPMYVLGGVGVAAVVIERLWSRSGAELVWPDTYLLFAFVGMALLSCLGALWMRYALENALTLVKFTVVYLLILHTVDTERRLRALMWTMVLGALFPAVGTISNYVQGHVVEGRAGWVGIFANPNEMAYSLVILVPLAACLAASSRRSSKLLLAATVALYIAAVYLSFSRGGLLGLLAVAVLLGWKWRSAPALALSIVILAGTALFLAYGWTRGAGFSALGTDVDFQQRIETFEAGWNMFMDHPLTGVGIGCSVVAWPLYAPNSVYTPNSLITHNTFIQALSETGLLGFLAYIVLLSGALLRAWRSSRKARERHPGSGRLGSALEVSLWAFAVCGLSGGWVLSWFPYILFALAAVLPKIMAQAEGELA